MSAVVIAIADAVVSTLNGASLTPAFTAERFYFPTYDLQRDLSGLKVSVVPKSLSLVSESRHSDDYTYDIDVGVQQRIGNDVLTNAQIKTACDPLMLLVEAMIDLFRGKALAGVSGVECMACENAYIYIPMHLDEQRVFSSVATLTFKQVRDRP